MPPYHPLLGMLRKSSDTMRYFLTETGIGIRPPPGMTIGPGVWTRPRVNHPDLDALNKPHEDIQNSPNAEKKA